MNKTIVGILVVIVVIVAGFFFYQPADAPTTGLDVASIATEVVSGEAVLLDVRTPEELDTDGYALNSIHFDVVRLQNGELPEIDLDTKVYTYCKAGGRAGDAETILENAGYTNVENIGGLSDWEAAGGTVVRQ